MRLNFELFKNYFKKFELQNCIKIRKKLRKNGAQIIRIQESLRLSQKIEFLIKKTKCRKRRVKLGKGQVTLLVLPTLMRRFS